MKSDGEEIGEIGWEEEIGEIGWEEEIGERMGGGGGDRMGEEEITHLES